MKESNGHDLGRSDGELVRLRSWLTCIPAAAVLLDRKGMVRVSNRLAECWLSLDRKKLAGERVFHDGWTMFGESGQVVAAEDFPTIGVLRDGGAVRGAVFGISTDPERPPIWVQVSVEPDGDTGEEIDGVFAVFSSARAEMMADGTVRRGDYAAAAFATDLSGVLGFVDDAWTVWSGRSFKGSLGRALSDFFVGQEAERVSAAVNRITSGEVEAEADSYTFSGALGSERIHLEMRARSDDEGRTVGVSGTVGPSETKPGTELWSESERRFATVFNYSLDAYFLVNATTGRIVDCNRRALQLFECANKSEILGLEHARLYRQALSKSQLQKRIALIDQGGVWSEEVEFVTMRGGIFWGSVAATSLRGDIGPLNLVRVADISPIKKAEAQLKASLQEKEVLLKEVYHRVKNNLQVISALLRMQSRKTTDDAALEALMHANNRVMAMAMVHEKLYQAQNLASIDFLAYAQSLVGYLKQVGTDTGLHPQIEIDGDALHLALDQAIPLGLILNELVTNSIKHAFPGEHSDPRITVELHRAKGGSALFSVSDNGIGLPQGSELASNPGIGLRIVRMLVEQLKGTLVIEGATGLRVTVHLPGSGEG